MFVQRIDLQRKTRGSGRWHLPVIALAALAAIAPELVLGLTVSDSYRFNLLWPEQFGDLFRAGNLYPRWLPRSWDGMGSPVFYFYPPLFFWITALIQSLGGDSLPVERAVPLASMLLLAMSGFAMRAWVRTLVSDRRALAGAIAYMLTPYHLYDLYGRGALAEASAYASVPIVMLALARLAEGRVRYGPLLAAGYCALLLSHLPTALLVSVFLIPPYVIFAAARSARPARFIMLAAISGLVGVALAAIYVVPAVTLLRYVSPRVLSGAFYQPGNWFFWHFEPGPMGARMFLIIPASIAAFLLSAGAAWKSRSGPHRGNTLFWSGLTMSLVLLIGGAVPALWDLPGLALVQFPWRALLIVDFACVTLLAISPPSFRNPWVIGGTAAAAYAYVVLALMASHTVGRTWHGGTQTAAEIRASFGDAPEYLPAGTRMADRPGPVDVDVTLPEHQAPSADPPDVRIASLSERDGGMTVAIDSAEPARVTLPRFYFPGWELLDGKGQPIPVEPAPGDRLVSFAAPAGHSTFHLRRGLAPTEKLAQGLSALGLLCLALLAAMTFRRRGSSRPRSSEPRLDAVADFPL